MSKLLDDLLLLDFQEEVENPSSSDTMIIEYTKTNRPHDKDKGDSSSDLETSNDEDFGFDEAEEVEEEKRKRKAKMPLPVQQLQNHMTEHIYTKYLLMQRNTNLFFTCSICKESLFRNTDNCYVQKTGQISNYTACKRCRLNQSKQYYYKIHPEAAKRQPKTFMTRKRAPYGIIPEIGHLLNDKDDTIEKAVSKKQSAYSLYLKQMHQLYNDAPKEYFACEECHQTFEVNTTNFYYTSRTKLHHSKLCKPCDKARCRNYYYRMKPEAIPLKSTLAIKPKSNSQFNKFQLEIKSEAAVQSAQQSESLKKLKKDVQ